MKKVLIIFLSISLFTSIDMVSQSKKELRKQKEKEEYLETKKLIESGNYIFEAEWAIARNGRRINIIAEGNKMTMNDQKSTADLPFFGESYGGAPYGGGGIKFDGEISDFEIKYKDKKNKLTITFQIRHEAENFDVILNVYSSGNSSLQIQSTYRSNMSYDGNIKEIPEEKEQ